MTFVNQHHPTANAGRVLTATYGTTGIAYEYEVLQTTGGPAIVFGFLSKCLTT